MSTPNGSTPWSPGDGSGSSSTGSAGGEPGTTEPSEDQPGLVNEPVQRTTVPIKIMIGALVALLVTVGAVAFITTRTTGVVAPPQAPSEPEPTGPPVLPLRAGELAREPGDVAAPLDFGVDRSIQTTSARYLRNGEPAVLAVGARPVEDEKALFDTIRVRAQRQVGNGWCGREDTNDLDTCVVRRGRTAVLTIGLRDQTPEEIMQVTQAILAETT